MQKLGSAHRLANEPKLRNDPGVSDFVHPNDNLKARSLRALFVSDDPHYDTAELNSQVRKARETLPDKENGALPEIHVTALQHGNVRVCQLAPG